LNKSYHEHEQRQQRKDLSAITKNLLNKVAVLIVLIGNGLLLQEANCTQVDERGYWIGEDASSHHLFDEALAHALADFFIYEKASSVVDLGCGMGDYTGVLLNYQIPCDGYDGNPDTPMLTNGLCSVLDLSTPADLGKRYDWVLSLEVGEHLPKKYEEAFVENLDRHNIKGIVLSWAVKGQGGFGHYNCQDNDYIKDLFASYGYVNDLVAENALREQSSFSWFKYTLMVFRRP